MDDAIKSPVKETVEKTEEAAVEISRNPWTQKLARFGFYSKGFLFIVIGVLAILVALGYQSGKLADPTGALATVAQSTFGKLLLVIFVAGAIGHGIWNILRGVADIDDAGGKTVGIIKRIIPVGVGIFYFGLAWSAWSIVAAARVSTENGEVQKTLAAILLALPLGAVLLFLIGLTVMGAGVHECYSGFSGKFRENFKEYKIGNYFSSEIITVLGILSFTARALILLLMGYFFITAAFASDANEAVGIDGVLLTLARTYYGKTILFVTAAGLVCHGILSLYEAKYRRLC
ncbi:MAG: DUF1206 domain-containing protein [Saprospiraceae bacterium]|nr:DUF1206 domain-containing protein [Pyrinomonadaceae bacterium]